MKSTRPITLLLCLSAMLMLFAAPAKAQFGDEPFPAKWTPPQFAYVKAYLYGLDGGAGAVFSKGRLDSTVVDTAGILLSPEQAQRLLAYISPPDRDDQQEPNMCYEPHHGFVFYNDAGRAVGQFSPCLICATFRISQSVKNISPAYTRLRTLIKELGMPVFNDFSDGKKYAAQLKAGGK